MTQDPALGRAWIALCGALAVHVADEALTGFLSVYNPTVLAIRERLPWFPMPVFEFANWLAGLALLIAVLLALAPLMFRGVVWLRPVAWGFAVLMLLNGIGHTLGTLAGRTVDSVHFARPMPGFYSSPVLLAASLYLMRTLLRRRSNNSPASVPV